MKKFAISLIALAAVSTASFASIRDVTTPYGAQDTQQAGSVSTSNALAIPATSSGKAGDDMGPGGSNRR
jgi:hypothetical protein